MKKQDLKEAIKAVLMDGGSINEGSIPRLEKIKDAFYNKTKGYGLIRQVRESNISDYVARGGYEGLFKYIKTVIKKYPPDNNKFFCGYFKRDAKVLNQAKTIKEAVIKFGELSSGGREGGNNNEQVAIIYNTNTKYIKEIDGEFPALLIVTVNSDYGRGKTFWSYLNIYWRLNDGEISREFVNHYTDAKHLPLE